MFNIKPQIQNQPVTLTDIFQHVSYEPNIFVDQGHFSDPDFISRTHQRENVQFADKSIYISTTPMVVLAH
jgi:hypothetical protein